jgi:hypothetical protein
MSQVGTLVKTGATVVVVVAAVKTIGYLLQMLAVLNKGLTVAASGGNIAPYIEALILIMVVAAVPGWLLTVANVDLG